MMTNDDVLRLVKELCQHDNETEWIEFKANNKDPKVIGKDVSALANSATLCGVNRAYMIWGVRDTDHAVVGTSFNPACFKTGNEELEHWLHHQLSGNASFEFLTAVDDGKDVVVLSIAPALSNTVDFESVSYIRIGSYTKPLKKYPAREAEVWSAISKAEFESMAAMENLELDGVLALLGFPQYFELLSMPLPQSRGEIARYLQEDNVIARQDDGRYCITNLGAILFAKDMGAFPTVTRKRLRIVRYEGTSKLNMLKSKTFDSGYSISMSQAYDYLMALLPSEEPIDAVLRTSVEEYPGVAIREILANILIHQDFAIAGAGPVVEVFDNRIEFTNPGASLVELLRLVDNPPRSRNQQLASLMRRFGLCEELGTGWDKIVAACERGSLPAPAVDNFTEGSSSMRVVLRARVPFSKMKSDEKVMAAYWHACLRYLEGEAMTNASLRGRFSGKGDAPSATTISRLIAETTKRGLVKPKDPNAGKKYMSYVPSWA